jgi:hypothetical protein
MSGTFVAIVLVVALVGLASQALRRRSPAYLALGVVACPTCGGDRYAESAPGGYTCPDCGYDTEIPEEGERARLGPMLRQLAIFQAQLDAVDAEFAASQVHNSDQNRHGHLPELYQRALENAEDLADSLSNHPALGPLLASDLTPLYRLPDLPVGVLTDFNASVQQARAVLPRVAQAMASQRTRLLTRYQGAM